jgi:Cu+-exporting ATPase
VATGRAAESGLLVRRGEAFEVLRRAEVIVLDKTGTLTEGKPKLVGRFANGPVDETELLRLAASVERGSEHPLATAILEGAAVSGSAIGEATNFLATPGSGVAGFVDGQQVVVGNEAYLAMHQVDTTPLSARATAFAREGHTAVLVAVNGVAAGILAIADPLRSGSSDAVRELRQMGLRVVMLTGDRRETAEVLARNAGIDEVISEVLPAGKVDAVKRLQNQGLTVVMAGDGINDAPGLSQANCGIALGTGADIATNAADVTLMRSDLRAVVEAIRISRRAMQIMKQNLFWAFIYNVLGIPVAAGVLYPAFGLLLSPMLASAAMAASSVSVLTNSLRLRTTELR